MKAFIYGFIIAVWALLLCALALITMGIRHTSRFPHDGIDLIVIVVYSFLYLLLAIKRT